MEGQAGGPGGNARKPPGTQVFGSAQIPAARRNPRAYSEQGEAATTSVSLCDGRIKKRDDEGTSGAKNS